MDTPDYHPRRCPVSECGAEVYIATTSWTPVVSGMDAEDFRNPDNATSRGWRAECSEGHVLVLPITHAGDEEVFGICEECSEEEGGKHPMDDPHLDITRLAKYTRGGVADEEPPLNMVVG